MTRLPFGVKFRRAYEAHGFTRSSLAEASGLAYNTIQRWEDGESAPTLGNLESAARALGVSAAELLADTATYRGGADEARNMILALGERAGQRRGWRSALARAAAISPSFVTKIASGNAPVVSPQIVERIGRLHALEGFPWDAAHEDGDAQPAGHDREIAAMQAIANAVRGLDPAARDRVLTWAIGRWPAGAAR